MFACCVSFPTAWPSERPMYIGNWISLGVGGFKNEKEKKKDFISCHPIRALSDTVSRTWQNIRALSCDAAYRHMGYNLFRVAPPLWFFSVFQFARKSNYDWKGTVMSHFTLLTSPNHAEWTCFLSVRQFWPQGWELLSERKPSQ